MDSVVLARVLARIHALSQLSYSPERGKV